MGLSMIVMELDMDFFISFCFFLLYNFVLIFFAFFPRGIIQNIKVLIQGEAKHLAFWLI